MRDLGGATSSMGIGSMQGGVMGHAMHIQNKDEFPLRIAR